MKKKKKKKERKRASFQLLIFWAFLKQLKLFQKTLPQCKQIVRLGTAEKKAVKNQLRQDPECSYHGKSLRYLNFIRGFFIHKCFNSCSFMSTYLIIVYIDCAECSFRGIFH